MLGAVQQAFYGNPPPCRALHVIITRHSEGLGPREHDQGIRIVLGIPLQLYVQAMHANVQPVESNENLQGLLDGAVTQKSFKAFSCFCP